MSLSTTKIILSALFAITLILLTLQYSSLIPQLPEFVIYILQYLPYILLLLIIANSYTHKQSHELNIAISILIGYWLMRNLIWPTDTNETTATILYVLIGPIIAINFIIVFMTQEKGIHNKTGLHLLLLLAFELMILIWFVNITPDLLLKYLYYPFFGSEIFDLTPMYQSTIIINAITFLILLINAIIKQKITITGYLGAFIAIVLTQHYINTPITSVMFYTVASLILILTISLNSYRLSKIDLITELPSRRTFKSQLKKLNEHFCIALIDIDDFKIMTDEYGQDVCDQILRMIASRSRHLGRKGFPYRYGDQEFAIIFYDMQLHEANKYLATLCDSIANEPFLLRSKKRPLFKPNYIAPVGRAERNTKYKSIPISVSVGIAEKKPHHQNSFDVLTTSREALNRAKEETEYFAEISY
ncbi:MAG: GGDEF domain-containing protein [Gammaproteobacteria bacterium]